MRNIAFLISFLVFSSPYVLLTMAGNRAALQVEIPLKSGKDKEKRAKTGQKTKEAVPSSPGSEKLTKSCCAKPSGKAALLSKLSTPVKKQ